LLSVIQAPTCVVQICVGRTQGERIFTQTKCVLLISDKTLLRQSFAMLLENRTGLRTVQADSPDGARELLVDLNGDVALVVASVDTSEGPDTGLIEGLHGLGMPIMAFGSESSTDSLARALDAGADDAITLGVPVDHFIGRAAQLASSPATCSR
jgi:DNA-binding NarL/FixJ family response regulator